MLTFFPKGYKKISSNHVLLRVFMVNSIQLMFGIERQQEAVAAQASGGSSFQCDNVHFICRINVHFTFVINVHFICVINAHFFWVKGWQAQRWLLSSYCVLLVWGLRYPVKWLWHNEYLLITFDLKHEWKCLQFLTYKELVFVDWGGALLCTVTV